MSAGTSFYIAYASAPPRRLGDMSENSRLQIIQSHIAEHVSSPSLRHIRDFSVINKLAQKIIEGLDGTGSFWTKWNVPREALLKSAAECSIPVEDMRDFLNEMPGPELTATDVSQRLRALLEENLFLSYPTEKRKQGSLAIYEREKALGTELPAIIRAIQEHVEQEKERGRIEHEAYRRAYAESERISLEERYMSGADCKWTSLEKSKELYCRINGRAYCLSPTSDKMWNLHRIQSVEDTNGVFIGKYRYRRDAGKALAQLAYQAEPRR
jgi:hypothetical protein